MAAVRRMLDQLARIDESVARWNELVVAAVADIEELVREVQDYSASIERDPGRLAEVEDRRDRIYRLLQKYGATVEAVLATHDEARRELDVLDTADLDLEQNCRAPDGGPTPARDGGCCVDCRAKRCGGTAGAGGGGVAAGIGHARRNIQCRVADPG